MTVIDFEPLAKPARHGQPGLFSGKDLPQSPSVKSIARSTGWWELDQVFVTYPGQFVVVTGLPGSGKSTFVLNVLQNMAVKDGVRSFMYVPENEQHLVEKLRGMWRASPAGFDHYLEHQVFVQSSRSEFYDDAPLTLHWILQQAIAAIENDGCDVILLDPWNELEVAKPPNMLVTDYVRDCLMWLKKFARHYGVTVFVVTHPTKAGLEHGLAGVEGSMHWYNKCDNGLIVERDPNSNITKVLSKKVREKGAGRIGELSFHVDPATERFTPVHGGVSL